MALCHRLSFGQNPGTNDLYFVLGSVCLFGRLVCLFAGPQEFSAGPAVGGCLGCSCCLDCFGFVGP